jgi:cbb3-type cytochrome oxidase subunit 3
MRLSDIMAAAGLGSWAQAALILFLVAFVLLLVAALAPRRRAEFERASRLPLGDDRPATPPESAGGAA